MQSQIEKQDHVAVEIFPTTFPEYNVKNNLPTEHKLANLNVKRLKHGHLRAMQRLGEQDQIHFLMSELTGLSQTDLDELDAEDSAKLSEVIFSFMQRFAKMARDMAGN
jgi:hypothetical protein